MIHELNQKYPRSTAELFQRNLGNNSYRERYHAVRRIANRHFFLLLSGSSRTSLTVDVGDEVSQDINKIRSNRHGLPSVRVGFANPHHPRHMTPLLIPTYLVNSRTTRYILGGRLRPLGILYSLRKLMEEDWHNLPSTIP